MEEEEEGTEEKSYQVGGRERETGTKWRMSERVMSPSRELILYFINYYTLPSDLQPHFFLTFRFVFRFDPFKIFFELFFYLN
jgi:hypothetical protein